MSLTDILHNQIAERCDDGNRSKELPEVAHQLSGIRQRHDFPPTVDEGRLH